MCSVQCVLPPTDVMDLADMAAAMAKAGPANRAGMAVYFLASLVNHSCEPNLDIIFPRNNGKHAPMQYSVRDHSMLGRECCCMQLGHESWHQPK